MKTRVKYVALMLAAILLCVPLASCDMAEDVKEGFEENLPFADLRLEDTFEDGKPYHLYYMSNGDGTCAVKYMTTNPENTEDFVIEIPKTSPTGDTVVEVDLQLIRSRSSWDPNESSTQLLPLVIRPQDLDTLWTKMQANGLKAFDLNKFKAYYLMISLTDMEEPARREAADAFPIAELGDIYVFDMNASLAEQQKIQSYLVEYAAWNEESLAAAYLNVLELVKLSESLEQAEACLSLMRYMGTEHAVGISIPDTVTSVGSSMWRDLYNLQSVTVDANNANIRYIDGCLINTETGTLLRCLGDGRILDGASITTIGSYAFVGCELGSAELYIPEGVTTLESYCFSDVALEDLSSITVHLPASLTLFEDPDAVDYIYEERVYDYAGTLQEWNERVKFTGVTKEDAFILLKTADMDAPEIFYLPVNE